MGLTGQRERISDLKDKTRGNIQFTSLKQKNWKDRKWHETHGSQWIEVRQCIFEIPYRNEKCGKVLLEKIFQRTFLNLWSTSSHESKKYRSYRRYIQRKSHIGEVKLLKNKVKKKFLKWTEKNDPTPSEY